MENSITCALKPGKSSLLGRISYDAISANVYSHHGTGEKLLQRKISGFLCIIYILIFGG